MSLCRSYSSQLPTSAACFHRSLFLFSPHGILRVLFPDGTPGRVRLINPFPPHPLFFRPDRAPPVSDMSFPPLPFFRPRSRHAWTSDRPLCPPVWVPYRMRIFDGPNTLLSSFSSPCLEFMNFVLSLLTRFHGDRPPPAWRGATSPFPQRVCPPRPIYNPSFFFPPPRRKKFPPRIGSFRFFPATFYLCPLTALPEPTRTFGSSPP